MKGNLKRVFQAMFMVLAMVMLLSVPAGAASSKTVATIGKKSYSSLQDAVKKVKNGQTIKLQKNVKVSSLTLNRNVKYTINLNGYKLKPGGSNVINIKKGTVTIKKGTIGCHLTVYKNASLTTSNVIMQSKYKPSITVNKKGKLTIKSGTYYSIGNYGTLSIKGGTFYGVINNWENAKLTIANGTFKPKDSNCVTNYSGKVTISGGTFTNSGDNCYMLVNSDSGASMTIKGGTFTVTCNNNSVPAAWNWRGAELNISGGAVFTVKNGSSEIAVSVIENGSGGILNISGGTLENLNTSRTYMHVINNSGTFKMSGGTLTASGTDSYALYNEGSATLTGGNLYSKRSYKVGRSGGTGESLSYNSKVNLNEADIYKR